MAHALLVATATTEVQTSQAGTPFPPRLARRQLAVRSERPERRAQRSLSVPCLKGKFGCSTSPLAGMRGFAPCELVAVDGLPPRTIRTVMPPAAEPGGATTP